MSEETEQQTTEPTEQTTGLTSTESSSSEDIDLDEIEKYIKEQGVRENWNDLSEDALTQQHKMLNSVFNKQQEIATNLNKVREDALKNLKQNEPKQEFEDDAEEYVKSIGMKALRETNPDFTDIVDEAKAIAWQATSFEVIDLRNF